MQLSVAEEGAQQTNRPTSSATIGGTMAGSESELVDKISFLQNQMAEQKTSNVQLSRQLITVTDKLAEKDT